MSKKTLQITDATVKFALGDAKPADWDAAAGLVDASCQTISAAIVANPVTSTVPATFCEGETDIVGVTKWALELSGLQDITDADGISAFLFDHDTQAAWVQIVGPDQEPGSKTVTIEAPVRLAAGNLLGPAGGALEFTATMPCQAKPTVTRATLPATP